VNFGKGKGRGASQGSLHIGLAEMRSPLLSEYTAKKMTTIGDRYCLVVRYANQWNTLKTPLNIVFYEILPRHGL
jgi:hypothetical protein